MSWVLPLFVLAMCVLCTGLLVTAAVSGRPDLAAADRLKVVSAALEALLLLFGARILVPWTPVTAWIWVGLFAATGAGIACAAWTARRLPWVAAPTRPRLLVRRVLGPAYVLALGVGVGLAYATLR